ncbi:MAG: hypothetical protein AUH14_07410 [Candidatus Rokubacteria bacterium 13_2_20CM_69_15_1]|nr:MAG: hypothetical protein AUH14_07410 [Candidatus Rokubacteria bacterium 13_2_20CM_69_15_1]
MDRTRRDAPGLPRCRWPRGAARAFCRGALGEIDEERAELAFSADGEQRSKQEAAVESERGAERREPAATLHGNGVREAGSNRR